MSSASQSAPDGVRMRSHPPLPAQPRLAWLHSHFLMWLGGTKFVFEVARRVNRQVPVDIIVERADPKCSRCTRRRAWGDRDRLPLFDQHVVLGDLSSPGRREHAKVRALKEQYSGFISSMFPMSTVAVLAGARPLTTYIMEPFAFFHDDEMIAGFPLAKRALLRGLAASYGWLDVWGTRASDELLTINAGTARWVKEIYGREAATSLLGVDTELFAPRVTRFDDQWQGRRIIIHSTDFTPLKRTSAAIDAIAALHKEMPDVLLLITCSHEEPKPMAALREDLQRRGLSDHVEVLGRVSHADLPHYYARADLSLYTGVGKGAAAASLFVLECMAAGTPGVRTNFTQDEMAHGESGFLYDPNDEGALLHALRTLLTDDALRARFGKAARDHVCASYQWDRVAQRTWLPPCLHTP